MNSLEVIVSYSFVTVVFLFIIYIAIWNFIHLGYWIKCFKVKTCNSRQCMFHRYCSKWAETYAEKEIEELLQLIEQHRKKHSPKITP